MKVASKVLFLLRDPEGLASAIFGALYPNPSSSLTRLEDSFEISLKGYGVEDKKSSGKISHYVDNQGSYQVSVLLVDNDEPPYLACAINEVLSMISGDGSSSRPTLLVPFLVSSSKLKGERETLASDKNQVSFYGIQIGQETDVAQILIAKTQKLPSSLQIHNESLASILHLVRVLKFPAFFLIGLTNQRLSNKSMENEQKILHEIGELLASSTSLHFSRDKAEWSPVKESRGSKEAWRDLYG